MRFVPRPRWWSAGMVATVLIGISGPAVPASAEEELPAGTVLQGTVVRAYVEHRDQQEAGAADDHGAPLTWVDPPDGAPVRVVTSALDDVAVGATVSVTLGGEVHDRASAADHLDPAQQVLDADVVADPVTPLPAATTPPVTDPVTVALVAPAGTVPDGTTLAQVESTVSGPVAQFWAAQSNGAVQIGVAGGYDWMTTTADCSDPMLLWSRVAQAVGFTPGAGKHLLLYLPRTATRCAYGLGTVGGSLRNGGLMYVRDNLPSVIAHEFGHNVGLLHSGTLECRGQVETGTCDVQEYGDYYDVMGASWTQVGSLNAVQSDLLGFLPSGQVQAVSATDATGTVALDPISGTTGTRAVRLVPAAGDDYLVEYRPATGRDDYLDTTDPTTGIRLKAGVQVRRAETDSAADSSMLLDGTPSSGSGFAGDADPVLAVGVPVAVGGGQFTLTLTDPPGGTASVQVTSRSPITLFHDGTGGDAGPLGPATGAEAALPGGGRMRTYANGAVVWSPATGAHTVVEPVLSEWTAWGGATGRLGYPIAEARSTSGGGVAQDFQGGSAEWSTATGPHPVLGAIKWAYDAAGARDGYLGYPVGDEYPTTRGGWSQDFQNGVVVWSPTTGAHAVSGTILDLYDDMDGESGRLAFPVGDQYPTAGGWAQAFGDGRIYSSPVTGAHAVMGALGVHYEWLRGPAGRLGFPVGDEYSTGGGRWAQDFQGGTIRWSSATWAHSVLGGLARTYAWRGSDRGRLGLPLGEEYPTAGGGWAQDFQGGRLVWAPWGTGYAVMGALLSAYNWWGAAGGRLGLPVSDEYPAAGGWAQNFQGGSVYWSPQTGVHPVLGGLGQRYQMLGPASRLGFPVSDEYPTAGGWAQNFQGGVLCWSPITFGGAQPVMGGMLGAYAALAGPNGPLGQPLWGEYQRPDGSWTQEFGNGTIFWTARTGGYGVYGGIRSAYFRADVARLGYPTSVQQATRTGAVQYFEHGRITLSGTRTTVVYG